MKRQIVAIGGGGFLVDAGNRLMETFFLGLTGKKKPKVCFVGTASGDAANFHERFYAAMAHHEVEASHLSLFKPPPGSLEDFVLDKDAIYVGGGNTRNLMALWKEWKLDIILRKAYQNGTVMGGVSAGSLCWFEQGVTDSITGILSPLECMGILKGSNCPHYDGEPERRPAYQKLVAEGMKPGIACDDGVGAYFVNETLVEFVSSVHASKGYRVSFGADTGIEPRYLG